MWPFTQIPSLCTPSATTESSKPTPTTRISEHLTVRSKLFSELPLAIFYGPAPSDLKNQFLIHGGSELLLRPHAPNTTPPRKDVFGVDLVELPIKAPTLVFTSPTDTTLLVDRRGYPLVKYSYDWIGDSVRARHMCDLGNYVVPYSPSRSSSPSPQSNGRTSRSSPGSHLGKHKADDRPVEASSQHYLHLAKRLKLEQDMQRRHSPHLLATSSVKIPKYRIGHAIIAFQASHSPPSSTVEIVSAGKWTIALLPVSSSPLPPRVRSSLNPARPETFRKLRKYRAVRLLSEVREEDLEDSVKSEC